MMTPRLNSSENRINDPEFAHAFSSIFMAYRGKVRDATEFPDLQSKIEAIHELDEALAASLRTGEVDGHYIGMGKINIFISTKDPEAACQQLKDALKDWNVLGECKTASTVERPSESKLHWPGPGRGNSSFDQIFPPESQPAVE